jgi:L-arabinose isomerase
MKQIWFITGSQNLYGEETLRQVAEDSKAMTAFLNTKLICELVYKPVVKSPEEITEIMKSANKDDDCIGVITWMHTFSPSKMWISGLNIITKPILHLHTQFNLAIPYDSIDMDFMNLNQSAHGDREHGFIYARMRKARKVVAGYWQDKSVIESINTWIQAAIGFDACKSLKVCRFGDNMREVAVTEGNKVSAEIKLGWSISGYGIGDLVEQAALVTEAEIEEKLKEYQEKYQLATEDFASTREQARYEVALKCFMTEGGFGAFTTNFECLHGMKQLPGLAAQRMMEMGYGFGAEGDWKTAALLRVMKLMAGNKATSFMEDYTYNLEPGNERILGAHMLEVCPTIASGAVRIGVEPLGIGGKEPPARMLFDAMEGEAIAVTLIDLGNRFRMIISEVECLKPEKPMPKLPVASATWRPYPNFKDGVWGWIIAGGAHHTAFSYAVKTEAMQDLSRMLGIECVVIGKNTDISRFESDLMLGDIVWSNK